MADQRGCPICWAPRAGQFEVLRQLATGLSNRVLAERPGPSEHTAKTHVAHILSRLGLRDRVQAVILAYETGLVRPGEASPWGPETRAVPCPFGTGSARWPSRCPRTGPVLRQPNNPALQGTLPPMQLSTRINQRSVGIAVAVALLALALAAAVAYAGGLSSGTPALDDRPIPVEPDGGIGSTPGDAGGEVVLPVEPDGGIGSTPDGAGSAGANDGPIPVEPDGGIGTTPDDHPIPVEPDGGIGTTP